MPLNEKVKDLIIAYKDSEKVRSLVKIVPKFGKYVDAMIENHAHLLASFRDIKNIYSLLNSTIPIDNYLLSIIRSLPDSKKQMEVYTVYEDLVTQEKTRSLRVNFEDLIKHFQSRSIIELVEKGKSQHGLIIDVEKLLVGDSSIKISYSSNRDKLALEKAALILDCNCFRKSIQDSFELEGEIPCPIHSHDNGKAIIDQFYEDFVEFRLLNLSILWKDSSALWPPSIDVVHMIDDLQKNGIGKLDIKSAIDIGSGTGLLGIWLAKENKNLKELAFSDWLLTPLIYSAVNAATNLNLKNINCSYFPGLNTNWVGVGESTKKYDLILCNPPYVPILDKETGFLSRSTVAGTDLLEHVIGTASNFAKNTFISFSNLANKEAISIAKMFNKELVPIGDAGGHKVPFRVPHALENINYVHKLVDERGLIVDKKSHQPFWHIVTTYEVLDKS